MSAQKPKGLMKLILVLRVPRTLALNVSIESLEDFA